MAKHPEAAPEALGLLGLARRAGAVVSGTERARRALGAGEVMALVLAGDASAPRLEKWKRLAEHRRVPVRWVSRRDVLGRALGAGPLSVVGVTTRSFATQLLRDLPSDPPDSPEGEGRGRSRRK